MRKRNLLALATLLGAIGFMFGATSPAFPQKPTAEETLTQRLARTAKVSEDDVTKIWNQLGLAIREELTRGKQVNLPGLGTFRVVRIQEHKDIRDGGRPFVIPASNTVEFLPSGELGGAVNEKGVEPAETVPAFRYIVLPNQVPSQRAPSTRVPGQRIRD